MQENEIVLYQPNDAIHLEVRMADESVWLTQPQIALLFGVQRPAITKHLRNIFKSGELEESSVSSILEHTATDGKVYQTQFYNLDAILSVGYRVNSINATMFRKWANSVLKEYLLKGYSINQRFERLEQRVSRAEEKIDFFVRTSLPPVEGVFFDGQIYDAYELVSRLVKSARSRIILIDNYIDESVLTLLDKRKDDVSAKIYTQQANPQLQLDIQRHDSQYAPIPIHLLTRSHDRFLLIDDDVYHIGASIKDLGKRWFAIMKMQETQADEIIAHL
ncbi:MAG: virulence RhuM family protein [Bacteroidaceae bacterium]|nr:virulence RhuM family protein [Bacteroidaceae bacterium]